MVIIFWSEKRIINFLFYYVDEYVREKPQRIKPKKRPKKRPQSAVVSESDSVRMNTFILYELIVFFW